MRRLGSPSDLPGSTNRRPESPSFLRLQMVGGNYKHFEVQTRDKD